MNEKTILKLHANGDFETVGTHLIQSTITNDYKFTENTITVPKIVKYDPTKTMPSWVVDTENQISIFPEGVVIKGELIETDNPMIIFKDDFNRANSSTLGGNWIIESGGFSINNNVAKPTNLSITNNVAVIDVGVQDNVSIELGVLVPNVSEGIFFRQVDSANYFYVYFELGDLLFRIRENNVNSVVSRVAAVANPGNTYNMKIELRGTEIKIFIDNVLKTTYISDKFLNGTKCGLRAYTNNGTIGSFDNFEVRRLV